MSQVYKLSNPVAEVPSLSPLHHYGPITSVKFLNSDIIFSSNGPSIQVFNKYQLKRTIHIFSKQKIHGICISSCKSYVVLWGGKSFTFVRVDDLLCDATPKIKEYAINDWIMTATFSWDSQECYILSSHNTVFTVNISSCKVIDTKNFLENSIVYSGSIKVFEDRVMIASGTILGGVFVWNLSNCKLIHNLIGHEGAIFGVNISETGDFLCSCSDDRSIKVWDLDTGSNVSTGWGHTSRIWQLQWFDQNKIMSCGEDATARVWEYIKNEDKILYCRDVWELHQGKHIWSGDVDTEAQIAVTGGGDGRLRLIDLAKDLRTGSWRKEYDIGVMGDKSSDIFKNYVQIKGGLFVISAHGACYSVKGFEKWEFLFQDKNFDNFQLLNYIEDQNLVLITSKTGYTTVLKFDANGCLTKNITIPKPESIKGKITNVLTTVKSEEEFLIFFESPNPKDDFVLSVVDFQLEKELTSTVLPRPDTRFISTCICYDKTNNWVFIGSRYVTFIVYELSGSIASQYWKKFVKGDTITSCSIVNSIYGEIVVLMTVRDGDFFYLKIDEDFCLEVLQHNKVARGFLEGGFMNENDELILLNFKSDTFHLWNETRQLEIFKELCGGAHRTWKLRINDSKTHDYNFIYNKASSLISVNTGAQVFPDSYLTEGTHGREIRDISIASTSRKNESRLVLTGAEDTTVKLSALHKDGSIQNFTSLRHHVSGIQKVKFIHNSQYAASTAAREEFFIWKIDDSHPHLGPLINRYAVLTPSSSEPDLRIMDFDTIPIYSEQALYGWLIMTVYSDSSIKVFEFNLFTKQFKAVLEDRYSTCCLWDARLIFKKGSIYAMIGSTDGFITIYDLTSELVNLYEFDQDESLILKEQPELEIDPEIEAEIGTKFENIPYFPQLVIKQQIHQSGIKSHTLVENTINENYLDLVTGGDDNALIQTRLFFEDNTVKLEVIAYKDHAASCTITGVSAFPSLANESICELFVVSVDQILRYWVIDYSKDATLKCIDTHYTTIGDTGCSEVTRLGDEKLALVGGAGLSSWKLKTST